MGGPATFTIGEVAERTGITEATLRAWEQRFGFPTPARQPSGHRRYTEADCSRLVQVLAERDAGRSLAAAIERVRHAGDATGASAAARLRAHHAVPAPSLVSLRTMRALSHAVEDEASASAGRPVLAAAFQTEEAYRRSEHRWRDLAEGAEVAVALAAFARPGRGAGGPVEVPLPSGSPLRHEWVVACHGPTFTAALAGWERPTPPGTPEHQRLFEAVWTVDPEAARSVIEVLLGAGPVDRALAASAEAGMGRPLEPGVGEVAGAVALANRMVAYAARP